MNAHFIFIKKDAKVKSTKKTYYLVLCKILLQNWQRRLAKAKCSLFFPNKKTRNKLANLASYVAKKSNLYNLVLGMLLQLKCKIPYNDYYLVTLNLHSWRDRKHYVIRIIISITISYKSEDINLSDWFIDKSRLYFSSFPTSLILSIY